MFIAGNLWSLLLTNHELNTCVLNRISAAQLQGLIDNLPDSPHPVKELQLVGLDTSILLVCGAIQNSIPGQSFVCQVSGFEWLQDS